MLFAVIGSSAGKTRDQIMAIYPRHKAFLDQFLTRGEVVGVGPFTDPGGGNMALFRSRAAAEAFAKSDPFFLEGAVREYQGSCAPLPCTPFSGAPRWGVTSTTTTSTLLP